MTNEKYRRDRSLPGAVVLCETDRHERVFTPQMFQELATRFELVSPVLDREGLLAKVAELNKVEVVWTTWNAPKLSVEDLAHFPHLRLVLSATGTVKSFARPFLERGVRVCSAKAANAVPVAEFCVGHILLAGKEAFRNAREYSPNFPKPGKGIGNYGTRVGFIGGGEIARTAIRMLRPFDFTTAVVDPFVSPDVIASLGCEALSLEQCFATCHVVSSHLPNLPNTRGLITGDLLSRLPKNATFINSARGAQVCEDELVEVWQQRPDLTAILDVTHPTPPDRESKLWTLPNVVLTSHIAGSHGAETNRMLSYLLNSYDRFCDTAELAGEVTLESWDRIA